MKPCRILSTILLVASLARSTDAHGGHYQPPPSEPPPPSKPGGSGIGTGPAPKDKAGPSGPSGASTPGPAGPGAGPAAGPATLGGFDPDLSIWSAWWDLNKAPYLDLKRHVRASGPATGSDAGFLGEIEREHATLQPSDEEVRARVVPALFAVLEKETNNDLVTGAMVALAKIGDDGSVEDARRFESALARFLADGNQEIQETAGVALGILASPRSIPTLANLLWDTAPGRALVKKGAVDDRTRAFAAYGLGLIGARTTSESDRTIIVATLRRAFESDTTASRDLAVACLVAYSIVPLATLESPGAGADDERRPPETSRVAQLEYLLDVLVDRERHEVVRAQCPVALARLLTGIPVASHEPLRARIAGELIALVERKGELPALVQSALLALGQIGTNGAQALDARIRAALMAALAQAAETQARGFALIALAQVGGRPGEGSTSVADVASFLSAQMIDGKSMLRPWAGLACGVLGHELARTGAAAPTLDRLRRAVRSVLADERNPESLGAYAIAAGLLGDAESAPLLTERLAQDLQEDARGWVAVGLALMGHREARVPLRGIVTDALHRPLLLRECAIALGVLEDKEAAPLLARVLKEAGSLATQTAIAIGLGFIGDRRSLAPLLEALHDSTRSKRARGYAGVALGNVADKESLPWNTKLALGLNYRAATSTLTDPVMGGGILDIL